MRKIKWQFNLSRWFFLDISVVISVYSIERAKDLLDCVNSLKQQSHVPLEIIVVLDPKDAIIKFYRKLLGDKVKLVISNSVGLSAARNEGVKNANGDIIAFIDDDAVADINWLQRMVTVFEDPTVIGVGGRIIPVWPAENPKWFPEELYWVVGCSYKGLPQKKAPIRNPIGCNMAFRKSVFAKIGYFSTTTGRVGNNLLGHDDTEFGMRATNKLSGTQIIYDPHSIVYHRVSMGRVSLKYVLKRSYAEGYSKALVIKGAQTKKTSLNTEKVYLASMFLGFPSLLTQNSLWVSFSRTVTLWVATAMVFLGYLAGLKYKA
jgi:GT2 family glycosyltransferase